MLSMTDNVQRPLLWMTILLSSLVGFPSSSWATCNQQIFRDEQERPTVPLAENCPAPFEGILIDRQKVRELGQRAEAAEETLRLTLTSTRAYWAERLRHQDEVHDIELDAERAKREAVEDRLPKWFEKPAFVIPITIFAVAFGAWGMSELIRAATGRD